MKKLALALVLAGPAAGGGGQAPLASAPSYPIEQAPPHLAAAVQAADAALAALQRRLAARLLEELQKEGPARALSVCRDEAAALTAEVALAQGIRVGRTSHRLRNPGNVPPPWAEGLVAAAAGRKAAAVDAVVVDLGERVGVLRPIAAGASCLQCHGPRDLLSPAVRGLLEDAYPADRAVGFEEGDLRGFAWAEAPAAAPDAAARLTGEQLFATANPRCLMCHSAAGKGSPQGPPLDGVGRRLGRDEIKAWIRTPREMARKRGSTRKPAMVPYPELTDEELDALAGYVAGLEAKPRP